MPLALLLLIVLVVAAPATADPPARPDLLVASVSAPSGDVAVGAPFSLSATVSNKSGVTAGATKLGFFLSRDAKRSGEDLALGQVSIGALKGGKKSNNGATATIPAGTIAGTYSMLACADAKAKVSEKKEKNNCRQAPLTIEMPPPGALPYGNDALPAQPEGRGPEVGDLLITEFFADPDSPGGDANGDGEAEEPADEFVELVNISSQELDLTGVTIKDQIKVRHTFPAVSLASGCSAVVFGGGSPTGIPGAVVETASTGTLELNNNTPETITFTNTSGVPVASQGFGEATANNSWTMPSAVPASYFLHTTLPGSIGGFSPGTLPDDSAYC